MASFTVRPGPVEGGTVTAKPHSCFDKLSTNGALRKSYGDKLFESFALGLGISASVYNLFNENYSIVAGQEYAMTSILQNGTNYRIVFSFKY